MGALDRMKQAATAEKSSALARMKFAAAQEETRAKSLALSKPPEAQEEKQEKSLALPKPSLLSRVGNTLKGAAKSYGAALIGAAESLANIDLAYQNAQADYDAKHPEAADRRSERAIEQGWRLPTVQESAEKAQRLQQTGSALKASGAADIERAKQGLGKLGSLAVDVGVAGAQMAGDVAAGTLTGGGAMLPMLLRSYGGGAQEAREKGYTTKQQAALGLANAATEYFTEKLFGGNPVYDADAGLVNRLVGKLVKNDKVLSALSSLPADLVSEGLEEVVSDVLQPVAERIIAGTRDERTLSEKLTQYAEDFAVGAALGGIGQGAHALRGKLAERTGTQKRDLSLPRVRDNLTSVANNASEAQKTASGEAALVRQVRESIPAIEHMNPVTQITGVEISKSGRIVDRLVAFANSFGNKVHRNGFGDILFSRGRIKNAMLGHGVGEAKIEVFAAVPSVIKSGVQIGYEQNWKGRGYDSFVFAAPIEYKGNRDYLGVIVTKDASDGRYYVHEVVDSDGNLIFGEKENAGDTSDGRATFKGTFDTVVSPANSDTTIPPPSNAVKPGDDGLGAAEAGSVNSDYDRLQAQSDTFHDSGPAPVRHTDVPTKNFEGRNIPKSASTVYGAQGTPDAAVMQLEKMIADGTLAFDTITDKDAVAAARTAVERKGFDGALEQYRAAVDANTASKDNTALGQQLLLQAMREGNRAATAELLTLYTRNATNAAQALQAQSIFRKLSPEGQLVGIQKAVNSFNEKHGTDIKIPEADVGAYLDAKNDAEREAVRERIYKNVAQQAPGTFRAKFDAIRYLAMLGNPRTHIRNILGNALFQAPVAVKNRVGALGEVAANAVTGGKAERTKSLTGVNPFGSLAKEARADFEKVKGFLGQSGKFSEGRATAADIEKNVPAFSNGNFIGKGLNALSEGNSALLEAEDTAAKKFIYTQSLAGYLKANGVRTMQGLDSTEEGRALLDKARNYAAQEALRNTFNDRNRLSDAVASVGRLSRSGNPYVKGFGYVVEGALPFKRTPANILARAVEYSPAGAMNGIVQTIKNAKAGDTLKVSQGIDRLAAGLTGSALMALGWTLAGAGYLRGGEGDDEKQAAFDELRGHQNYSLELGDGTSVTLDWLAPEAIPLFMGAELYNAALDRGMSFDDLRRVFKNATSPMLEMSMLQGLNSLFDNAAYAQRNGDNVMASIAASALANYLTQTVPTVFGQAERAFGESERMATYTDKNKWTPTDWQYTLGKVSQKLPGVDYNQIPYIDAWGRTEQTGGLALRAVNNFANPAYLSQISDDAIENELQRLYDMTGDGGVLPQRAAKYFTVDGTRKDLTADEYVAYATEKGQRSRRLVSELLRTSEYAQMDDAARAKAVSELYSYANAKAKEAVSGIALNSTAAKLEAVMKSGIAPAQYFAYSEKANGLTADKDANGKTVSGSKKAKQMAVIDTMPLTGEQKDTLYLAAGLSESTIDDAPWNAKATPSLKLPEIRLPKLALPTAGG